MKQPQDHDQRKVQPERRLSLRSLMNHLGITEVTKLAETIGMSRKSCYRYFASGLTVFVADKLAVAAGVHPLEVWPDFHDEVDWTEAA